MTQPPRQSAGGDDLDVEVIDATIDCARCDAACCRMRVLLLPDDRIADWLTDRDDHGLACMRRADDGWCVALDRDSMRCTIYSERPDICRDFAMGGGDCRDARAGSFDDAAADADGG